VLAWAAAAGGHSLGHSTMRHPTGRDGISQTAHQT
jgi:hypothetical protein